MISQLTQQVPWYSTPRARFIALVIFCAGIGLLLLDVRSTVTLVQLHFYGNKTRGVVVSQDIQEQWITRRVQGKDIRTKVDSYFAVVSFAVDNENFTIESYNSGMNGPLYPTDSKVMVVYSSGDPAGARLQEEIGGSRWLIWPLSLALFGAVLVGAAGIFLLKTNPEKRRFSQEKTYHKR